MLDITTCLWFDNNASEAVDFYVSVFPRSKRLGTSTYGPDSPGPEGDTLAIDFELDGHRVMAINGGPHFALTPAVSLVVNCADQAEIDHYWDALVEGGEPSQCGWLTDRYGLSWQIAPTVVSEYMSGDDKERANRVMAAIMPMVKLDLAAIEAAAAGSTPRS